MNNGLVEEECLKGLGSGLKPGTARINASVMTHTAMLLPRVLNSDITRLYG